MSIKLVSFGVLSAAIIASSPAYAATKEEKARATIASLTPEHFERTASLKDTEFDKFATITTLDGYQDKDGLLKIVNRDVLFRVFVDKKSGAATFQVYARVNYGGDWKFFQSVDYVSGGESFHSELSKINSEVGTCTRYGCSKSETFAFEVSEAYLRDIVKSYDHSNPQVWKLRFNAKDGSEWMEGFIGAEIVGVLRAVDKYRAGRGLSNTADVN